MSTSSESGRTRKCKVFRVKDAVRKSAAELLVLKILYSRPMYTYEMGHFLREQSGGVLSFSTLYQAIYRLQDLGYIEESDKVLSEDNRVRVYFAITEAGKAVLPKMINEYRTVVAAVDDILNLEGPGYEA